MEYKETILDALTGEITERPYTKEEIAAAKKIEKEIEAVAEKQIIEAETRAIAKQAILDRLGLTADEAKLILG